ncbi:TPA: hypothetical protein RGG13_001105 [Acinetobacter baumannii]|nr:hypothetical protein [Acinetobacter baumannii]
MYFRDPSKYKYTTDNIIVGHAELHAVNVNGRQGWALLGGGVTFDKKSALKYAKALDDILKFNLLRKCAERAARV